MGNLVWNFNIVETYVDKYDPSLKILDAAAFEIISTKHLLKDYSPRQLVFVSYMILLIKHKVDLILLRHKNQMEINKYNICKNNKRVYNDYKARDKVMLNKHIRKTSKPETYTHRTSQCFYKC